MSDQTFAVVLEYTHSILGEQCVFDQFDGQNGLIHANSFIQCFLDEPTSQVHFATIWGYTDESEFPTLAHLFVE